MKDYNKLVTEISDRFKLISEVEAVLWAGSRSKGIVDANSDIDLYIYSKVSVPVKARKDLAEIFSNKMEINNQFWEDGDEWLAKEYNMKIDISYRNINDTDNQLNGLLNKNYCSTGYSTCVWSNILDSKIIFDRNGELKTIQEKYRIDFPEQLKESIIKKNIPLLEESGSSYYHQLEVAVARKDLISVNHRISEYLASYFDILFAINKIPHPGEKKLTELVNQKCDLIPKNFEQDVQALIASIPIMDVSILQNMQTLTRKLIQLVEE